MAGALVMAGALMVSTEFLQHGHALSIDDKHLTINSFRLHKVTDSIVNGYMYMLELEQWN